MTTHAWKPLVLDLSNPREQPAFDDLFRRRAIWRVHDTIHQQLEDLACTRNPQWAREPGDDARLAASVRAVTKGRSLTTYGRWVYYPWSGDLVHLLPPPEFHELRLNRNQNKITAADQRRLTGKTIGIVGLSVGNAVATAIALEGLSGCLKLADFDRLDLSNMNRIRASVCDVGLPKTVLCARQIFEMNPYADVRLFESGLTEDNLDGFIGADPGLDVLVDECDDIRLKVLLREAARTHGVPVLMETSDRGMLDVERFDLEPERPLFHGLVGDLSANDIPADLSSESKLEFVAPIIGVKTLSTRSAASMLEIGETISTWPQLGSEVQLGGATVCAALRALFLEGDLSSGRRHIDLMELLKAGDEAAPADAPAERPRSDRIPRRAASPPSGCERDFMRFLVSYGILAPSGGNSQPWCFYTDDDSLWILHDVARSRCLLDVDRRGAYAALGAVIANVRAAAAHRGFATDAVYHGPAPACGSGLEAVARLTFRADPEVRLAPVATAFPWLAQRMTDRRTHGRQPLLGSQRQALLELADRQPCHLSLLEGDDALAEIGTLAGRADRLRMLAADTHREMMAEVRWSRQQALASRDGLDLDTLELGPSQRAALELVRRADVAGFLRSQDGGSALSRLSREAIRQSSAIGLICARTSGKVGLLRAGEGIQTLWLEATRLGLAWHPMTSMIYMFQPGFRAGFTRSELGELDELRVRFAALLPGHGQCRQVMLFRLSHGTPHDRRSLRRSVDEVLSRRPTRNSEETCS